MTAHSLRAPYQRIKDELIQAIKDGTYGPNDKVPSENALMKQYGVARMTAHRALRELTDEGVLARVPGVGTFVAEKTDDGHVLDVRNIADDIRARGHTYSADVIRRREETATGRLAELFRMPLGETLLRTRIVHLEGDMPLQLEDRWVNPCFAPDYLTNDFREITPTAYLLSKLPLQEVEHTIRAEMPSEQICELLRMPENEPCLVLTRRTSMNNKVITFARMFFPGSRYRLGNKFSANVNLD
ncbi:MULTISPECIES: histidine utilization repressor [Kordiimonas]|uniref:histidine utilization repressor n=1 Tax=Kordiimonas TaxID=288021 RepID=UPI00257CA060|nr:histidine utilization repressor [Kordiimonas sp. UBA4487]